MSDTTKFFQQLIDETGSARGRFAEDVVSGPMQSLRLDIGYLDTACRLVVYIVETAETLNTNTANDILEDAFSLRNEVDLNRIRSHIQDLERASRSRSKLLRSTAERLKSWGENSLSDKEFLEAFRARMKVRSI